MNNKNMYHTLPFIVFYRFLKSYNIQINYDIIQQMFPYGTNFYYIDRLVCHYLHLCKGNGIDKRVKSLSYHYLPILDFLWCVYIRDNYDKFSFITKGTNFFLKDRMVLSSEIYHSSGKKFYNGLRTKVQNIFLNSTLYDFQFLQSANTTNFV